MITESPKLALLNLEGNPLTRGFESSLSNLPPGIEIRITEHGIEEWEDLSI